jgi:hypothetical protein
MKTKYGISRRKRKNKSKCKRKNKSKCKRKNKSIRKRNINYIQKNNKTRKILHGGVVMPFSEISSIYGNVTNSLSNLINTVVLPPTPTYNPSLPIDQQISSQFLNNTPTQNLIDVI